MVTAATSKGGQSMLKRTILAFACALLVSSAAQAGDVTYVLQTPGVV
jgi:hypothetical protein